MSVTDQLYAIRDWRRLPRPGGRGGVTQGSESANEGALFGHVTVAVILHIDNNANDGRDNDQGEHGNENEHEGAFQPGVDVGDTEALLHVFDVFI